MKIDIKKTSYFFKIDRYNAQFGYAYPNGEKTSINEGEIVNIKILGIEINFYIVKKKIK